MTIIHYDMGLVALSYVIAVLGSYTALQLAIAIPQAEYRSTVFGWVGGSAVALGGAIWSMHFIGMNAADMGMPVAYDPFLTVLSLVIGIVSSAIGLLLVGRGEGRPANLVVGGVLTGLGVALMHYTGMAAMIMPAKVSYDTTIVVLSIIIALVAATAALWLAFNQRGKLQRFGSAIVMGVAVCGMHYTGMYAVRMSHAEGAMPVTTDSWLASSMGYLVFGVAAAFLLLLLLFSAWRSQRMLTNEF